MASDPGVFSILVLLLYYSSCFCGFIPSVCSPHACQFTVCIHTTVVEQRGQARIRFGAFWLGIFENKACDFYRKRSFLVGRQSLADCPWTSSLTGPEGRQWLCAPSRLRL